MLGKKFIIFFILVSIAVALRIKVYDINKIVNIDVSAKKDISPDVVILKIQFLQNGNVSIDAYMGNTNDKLYDSYNNLRKLKGKELSKCD